MKEIKLGTGLAENARRKLRDRTSQIDSVLADIEGKGAPKPKPKGASSKPKPNKEK